jgi:MFS family permease
MLAGIAIASFGVTICFAINAASFVAVLIALLMIKVQEPANKKIDPKKLYDNFKIGFDATFNHTAISAVILFLISSSFFGMPYINLFPAMGQMVGLGSSKGLGIITTMNGVGSLIAAILLAKRKGPPDLAKVIGVGGLFLGIFMAACMAVTNYYWLLTCVAFAGFGLMLQLSGSNTMVQTLAEDDKRSRILSFLLFSMMGVSPFGSLMLGALSEKYGIKYTFLISGTICAISAMVFLKKASKINNSIYALKKEIK